MEGRGELNLASGFRHAGCPSGRGAAELAMPAGTTGYRHGPGGERVYGGCSQHCGHPSCLEASFQAPRQCNLFVIGQGGKYESRAAVTSSPGLPPNALDPETGEVVVWEKTTMCMMVKRLNNMRSFGVPMFSGPMLDTERDPKEELEHWDGLPLEGRDNWKPLAGADPYHLLCHRALAAHTLSVFVWQAAQADPSLKDPAGSDGVQNAFTGTAARGGHPCYLCSLGLTGANKASWSHCRLQAMHLLETVPERFHRLGRHLLHRHEPQVLASHKLLWWLREFSPPGQEAKSSERYSVMWWHDPLDHGFFVVGTVQPLDAVPAELRAAYNTARASNTNTNVAAWPFGSEEPAVTPVPEHLLAADGRLDLLTKVHHKNEKGATFVQGALPHHLQLLATNTYKGLEAQLEDTSKFTLSAWVVDRGRGRACTPAVLVQEGAPSCTSGHRLKPTQLHAARAMKAAWDGLDSGVGNGGLAPAATVAQARGPAGGLLAKAMERNKKRKQSDMVTSRGAAARGGGPPQVSPEAFQATTNLLVKVVKTLTDQPPHHQSPAVQALAQAFQEFKEQTGTPGSSDDDDDGHDEGGAGA